MKDSRSLTADAFFFAETLHRGQYRKQTSIPYVYHLLSVAALVGEYGGSEAQVAAALLHDAVEDQGGQETLTAIEQRFGSDIATYVLSCTDCLISPKPPWRERKEAFISRVARLPGEVKLIVAADKLHNMLSLLRDHRQTGDMLWQRFTGGRDGTLWYYQAVTEELTKDWDHPILAELCETVQRLLVLMETEDTPDAET